MYARMSLKFELWPGERELIIKQSLILKEMDLILFLSLKLI